MDDDFDRLCRLHFGHVALNFVEVHGRTKPFPHVLHALHCAVAEHIPSSPPARNFLHVLSVVNLAYFTA
jgi:hypothetical protein